MSRLTEQELETRVLHHDTYEQRILYLEQLVDTYLHSPIWKRVWFVAMGWPADAIASQPRKRWWRRRAS